MNQPKTLTKFTEFWDLVVFGILVSCRVRTWDSKKKKKNLVLLHEDLEISTLNRVYTP